MQTSPIHTLSSSLAKDEEVMTVQDVEESDLAGDLVGTEENDGITSDKQMERVVDNADARFSFSYVTDDPATKKRPLACYVCKQNGHVAKVNFIGYMALCVCARACVCVYCVYVVCVCGVCACVCVCVSTACMYFSFHTEVYQ